VLAPFWIGLILWLVLTTILLALVAALFDR